MCLVQSLNAALAKDNTERPVSAWLKKHPLVISRVVGGHPGKVVAEFPFGSDYYADFVTLRTYSGGCDINFIELEPPGADLFTKKGRMAKHLNDAVRQVDDWRVFVDKNKDLVLRDLSKFFRRKELIFAFRDHEPIDECGRQIYDHRCWARWYYHILIGRRHFLNDDHALKKAAFHQHHSINVMTYDQMLKTAAELDDYERSRPKFGSETPRNKRRGLCVP